MSLLKNIAPKFEKTAAKTPLGDNDATWGSEILAALYKQHPFLGKYDIHLQMHGQDMNMGYMYGTFVARNVAQEVPKMNKSYPGRVDKMQSPDSQEMAKIPVIVEDSKLYSFDVFIDKQGKFLPLNENTLGASLFSIANYHSAPKPKAQMPSGMGMNPDVPLAGYGTDMSVKGSGSLKYASATLRALAQESKESRKAFVESFTSDSWLSGCLEKDAAMRQAVYEIGQLESLKAAKNIDPDTVLIEKVAGGFKVTRALSSEFKPEVAKLTNAQASNFPNYIKEAAIEQGHCLVTHNGTALTAAASAIEKIAEVTETGIYTLMEKSGEATQGLVITRLQKLSGAGFNLRLAITPNGACLQDKVAGIKLGDFDFSKIAGADPSGQGVFLLANETVTEPLTIIHKSTWDTGNEYLYEDSLGTRGILKEASVKQPIAFGKSDYLLPEDARFIPIKDSVGVMSDEVSMDKVASDSAVVNTVTLIADGSSYSLRGGCGISDLPYEQVNHIKVAQAALLLGALGDSHLGCAEKLKKASAGHEVKFVGTRTIKLASEKVERPLSREDKDLMKSLQMDLRKEAAALPSRGDTVNSVLSLSFLTPENVDAYVEALPEYEASLSKLCELLVAVRLGLPDVPEAAVLSCIKGLTAALEGFKLLAERRRHFDEM